MKPTIFVAGSPVLARIASALLQIEGHDFDRATATLDDDWIVAAAQARADAVVIEVGVAELSLLAELRRAMPSVQILAMSAVFVGDALERALEVAERETLVAWANLPCKLEAPLSFLADVVAGGTWQREHHELADVHYLVTEVVRPR